MVLDDGRIVSYLQTETRFPSLKSYFQAEFDSPKALLQKTDGLLKSLVDGSGEKNDLYAIVDGNGSNFSWDVVFIFSLHPIYVRSHFWDSSDSETKGQGSLKI